MTVSLLWLHTLFFVTIRLGVLLLFTPIQALRQLPIYVRLVLIFSLSLLLVNFVPLTAVIDDHEILLACLCEFGNGLILAASLYAAFAVFQIAGQLIDNQTGLNTSALFYSSDHQESLISHLLSMLSVLFFFNLQGQKWLFESVAYSFERVPPGSFSMFAGFIPLMKQVGFMWRAAFMLVSPMVLALLAVDLGAALITRNMPQISTYFLTVPIKIFLGLMLLALMLNYFKPLTTAVLSQCFYTWQELMS